MAKYKVYKHDIKTKCECGATERIIQTTWWVTTAESKTKSECISNGICACHRDNRSESDANMIADALNAVALRDASTGIDDMAYVDAGPVCPQCGHALTDGHCTHCEQRGM